MAEVFFMDDPLGWAKATTEKQGGCVCHHAAIEHSERIDGIPRTFKLLDPACLKCSCSRYRPRYSIAMIGTLLRPEPD